MKNFLLVAVFCIGFFLRFWQLDQVPPSLSHDEVAIGYNSYSLLKTGKDEYDQPFPLLFRSFDDYKLPGMVYATIPSVATFGLNEWGVRIPSALFGSLAVIVIYFLARELVRNSVNLLPLVTAFLFAVNPWAINFSRQSFESNGATFFFLLGTTLLLSWQRKPHLILSSALAFATSIYFYYSARVALLVVLLTFLVVYRKILGKHLGVVLTAGALGLFALLPIIPSLLSTEGFARIGMVSVVNDPSYRSRVAQQSKKIANNPTLVNRLIYNRRIALAQTVAENYLKNIHPSHLFATATRGYGLFHPMEAVFLLIGIVVLVRLADSRKWIVIAWLMSAPLVGALTVQQPNALRTLIGAPAFVLVSGLGAAVVLARLKHQKVLLGILGIIFAIQLVSFLKSYFVTIPKESALAFGDGYKQMVAYVSMVEESYDTIYITGNYWRPYIFMLFWKRYEPLRYQRGGRPEKFEKYIFGKAPWDTSGLSLAGAGFASSIRKEKAGRTLVIFSPSEWQQQKNQFTELSTINGRFTPAIFVSASF